MHEEAFGLTDRELQILILIANGHADKEIAQLLAISVFTVNKHVGSILQKIGAQSRTQAAIRALRSGVID